MIAKSVAAGGTFDISIDMVQSMGKVQFRWGTVYRDVQVQLATMN